MVVLSEDDHLEPQQLEFPSDCEFRKGTLQTMFVQSLLLSAILALQVVNFFLLIMLF